MTLEAFLSNITCKLYQWRTTEALFLNQPLILPFRCHKSATACQIDLNQVSSVKLKPNLWSSLIPKELMLQLPTPQQQPHKRGTIFLGTKRNFFGNEAHFFGNEVEFFRDTLQSNDSTKRKFYEYVF